MAPIGILVAFVAIEIQYVRHSIGIGNLDYFPFVDRAVQLSFSSWDGWVNWIHPVGLPWLVRIGLELGIDAARFGQALSISGGVLGLIGAYLLAWAFLDSPKMALVCQVFTATTGYFLFYAGVEGNDMLAAGSQVLSLGTLAFGLTKAPPGDVPRTRWIVLAGATAGLAYLIRYTGIVTIAVGLLILLGIALRQPGRAIWKRVGLYILIVVVITAVQWIPSLLVTGSPLGNDQGQNVWFHVYGKSDFLTEWNQAPAGITVAQVFAMDPGKFLRHWWRNFESFWLSPDKMILEVPLKLFGQAGLIYLLLMSKGTRPAVRILVGVFVFLHLAALSLMRLDPRFLIVLIPAMVVGAVYFFSRILPAGLNLRQTRLPLQAMLASVGLLFAIDAPLRFIASAPQTPPALIEASDTLHAGSMRDSQEVLSTKLRLHDLVAPVVAGSGRRTSCHSGRTRSRS